MFGFGGQGKALVIVAILVGLGTPASGGDERVLYASVGDTARSPRVVSDTGGFSLTLTRVGSTGVYAGVATLSHGTAFTWHYEAGDRRLDRKSVV